MPKNFVFNNPEHHQRIVSLLEGSGAVTILAATGRNASPACGVEPFPVIEDGDFDVPSFYMTAEEGIAILPLVGHTLKLESVAQRIPSTGYKTGDTAFSLFGLPVEITRQVSGILDEFPELYEGELWQPGDHIIFVRFGRPAIAVTSHGFIKNMENQDITHTPNDNMDVFEIQKLRMIAEALQRLIRKI